MKVLTLDMKMKGFFKGTIISLSMLLGFLLVGIEGEILFLNYPKAAIKGTAVALLSLLPYIILVTLSVSLTREFENKTDKTIFTGIFTRTEIIISKLMSFVATGLVCCVFYIVVSIIFGGFSFKGTVNSVMTFTIYTFALGSFTLLVSAITSNGIITGLIIYALHFDLSLAVLGQAMASTKSLFVKRAIENLPFFIANTGFKAGMYTFQQAFVMILYGVLALIITFVIINKKNI
ncbi:ABC-2 type transport system permease protein [Clostridium tetanomorphum]|uniref:ABC transporter permease n=2 Tax=Clostridium tetanomorphum TaxID=1553 RepID=A0A923E4K8_CLOTT|nr:ABC transporter permease [Clostridium tetanomorphum]MBC2396208.1 ABC transporter permease [Clostridium tetanomorphum]MBP1864371.1 ABC-2 type transport system permease protein [Clostridium tetanomorphum]NRS83817.1 ABC-2 type transport system permease protein [Clostridium tetanomorphum]